MRLLGAVRERENERVKLDLNFLVCNLNRSYFDECVNNNSQKKERKLNENETINSSISFQVFRVPEVKIYFHTQRTNALRLQKKRCAR